MNIVISTVNKEYILVKWSDSSTSDVLALVNGIIAEALENDVLKVLLDGSTLETFSAVRFMLGCAQSLAVPKYFGFKSAVVANWQFFSQDPDYKRALESHEEDLKRHGGVCKHFDDLGLAETWLRL